MSKLEKCPVCDGRGFVKGNFYDVAGETCSFGDYAKKQQSSTICMYCNGKGVANVGYIPEGEVDVKLKEYQVELKVKGEGGVYPYIVSAMKEEWAEQDAIQMLLRDFPIFNGKEISIYKIFCIENQEMVIKKALSFRTPKPITKVEKYMGLDNEWHKNHYCPTCERFVNENQKACSNCGQLLEWE